MIREKGDIQEVLEQYSFLNKDAIRFMPEGVYLEEHRNVFDDCIDVLVASGCNVAIRGQSIMRDAAKRGV